MFIAHLQSVQSFTSHRSDDGASRFDTKSQFPSLLRCLLLLEDYAPIPTEFDLHTKITKLTGWENPEIKKKDAPAKVGLSTSESFIHASETKGLHCTLWLFEICMKEPTVSYSSLLQICMGDTGPRLLGLLCSLK